MSKQASLLLGLLLLGLATAGATVAFSPVSNLGNSTDLISVHAIRKSSPLRDAWKAVWTPVRVTFNCSSAAYIVVAAPSLEALVSGSNTSTLWCGWQHILSAPQVCQVQLSPFRKAYVAVKDNKGADGIWNIGTPRLQCTVSSNSDFCSDSWTRIAVAAAAVVLFVSATKLASCQTFRLATGGLAGVAGLSLLLLMTLMKRVPTRRYMVGALSLSFSSTWALLRYMYGTWSPSIQDIITSKLGLYYICTTAFIGVALTYWLDDVHGSKLTNSIAVGLRGGAMGMLYGSIVDERVAVGAVVLLMMNGWLQKMARRVYTISRQLYRALSHCTPAPQPQPNRMNELVFSSDYDEPSPRSTTTDDSSSDSYDSNDDPDYDPDKSEDASEVEEEAQEEPQQTQQYIFKMWGPHH